ncbi:hypothetical protein GF324_12690 [bacterium]|nr:hypothetical protein [bacterium]
MAIVNGSPRSITARWSLQFSAEELVENREDLRFSYGNLVSGVMVPLEENLTPNSTTQITFNLTMNIDDLEPGDPPVDVTMYWAVRVQGEAQSAIRVPFTMQVSPPVGGD